MKLRILVDGWSLWAGWLSGTLLLPLRLRIISTASPYPKPPTSSTIMCIVQQTIQSHPTHHHQEECFFGKCVQYSEVLALHHTSIPFLKYWIPNSQWYTCIQCGLVCASVPPPFPLSPFLGGSTSRVASTLAMHTTRVGISHHRTSR